MTRFSACLVCALASALVACGGTAYTTSEDDTGGSGGTGSGTGGTAATGGATSGGAPSTGGTNGSTFIDASAFNQFCEWDSQCAPVSEGNVCGCNGCPNAAVNLSELEAFNTERNRLQMLCPVTDGLCPGAPCQEFVGSCPNGVCSARPAVIIDSTTFGDATCLSDADCFAIPAGEICSECRCSNVAVNEDGLAQYNQLLESVKCTAGPVACDCAAQGVAFCNLGTANGVCEIANPI